MAENKEVTKFTIKFIPRVDLDKNGLDELIKKLDEQTISIGKETSNSTITHRYIACGGAVITLTFGNVDYRTGFSLDAKYFDNMPEANKGVRNIARYLGVNSTIDMVKIRGI